MYVYCFHPVFSPAHTSYIGCLGSPHDCCDPDASHALLDMGQGTEARPHAQLPLTFPPHQGLEDRFDGANRRNLRHFIVSGEKGEVTIPTNEKAQSVASDNEEHDELASVQERYYYFARDKTISDSLHEQAEDRRELVRIPTCAIFHKFASGKGVPHSFVGFIRQWPALPQVVVSLPLVTPITCELLTDAPHKDLYVGLCSSDCKCSGRPALRCRQSSFRQRFVVSPLRSALVVTLPRSGFYGVTYYLGFREDFEVKVSLRTSRDRLSSFWVLRLFDLDR